MGITWCGGPRADRRRCPTWRSSVDRIIGWCTRRVGRSNAERTASGPRLRRERFQSAPDQPDQPLSLFLFVVEFALDERPLDRVFFLVGLALHERPLKLVFFFVALALSEGPLELCFFFVALGVAERSLAGDLFLVGLPLARGARP